MEEELNSGSILKLRNIALENVIKILEEKRPLHKVLPEVLIGVKDQRDRAFLSRLVRGCTERAFSLDKIIDSVSKIKVQKQKTVIRNILRCGVYQILFMDSVTDFAACNESVKLAGKRGLKNLGGFVNGILRTVCRQKTEFLKDFDDNEDSDCKEVRDDLNSEMITDVDLKKISFMFSMPEWITEMFISAYGEDAAWKAFRYFLEENRTAIRINTSKISPSDLEKSSLFLKLEKNPYITGCYYFKEGTGNIEDLPEFQKGLFAVQDMSSVLVGFCAGKLFIENATGKCRVLDLCAAPGGKSIHMADLGALVTACDISGQKTELIRSSALRCGSDEMKICINDAAVYNPEYEEKYDLVLCDLPCSGLGIIGRKPDIKYNVSMEKILELSILQKEILKNAVKYVKSGGFLIYSTCTVTREENMDNVSFLQEQLDMTGVSVDALLPEKIRSKQPGSPYIQILPGEYGSDGFFISVFRKKEKKFDKE